MRLVIWISVLWAMLAVVAPAQPVCDRLGLEGACEVPGGYYRIAKPDGPGPHPTVVYLYGSTGNSRQVLEQRGMVRAFTRRGYALLVPIALDVKYEGGPDSGWHLRHEVRRNARDEISYLEQVLTDAAQRHRIDRSRVLFAGQSRGAFLIWEIACHRPDLGTAYAPHAGGYLGKMPGRCRGPVRLLHTHGQRDTIVPLDPDKPLVSGGARMEPLPESLAALARTSGCDPNSVTDQQGEYARERWRGCTPGADIQFLRHSGGHSFPASWVALILDWFEGGRSAPSSTPSVSGTVQTESTGGGRPVFRRAGQGEGGTGGRFKRVPQ